jgi:hypothetical protein
MAKLAKEKNPVAGRNKIRSLQSVAKMVMRDLGLNHAKTAPSIPAYFGVKYIPMDKLFVNYKAQRWPIMEHILKFCDTGNWNPNAATPLYCRYDKKTDRYYIMDGQQHSIAWYILHGANSLIPVCGIESDDSSIEALTCLILNTESEPMSYYHIHQLQLEARIPEAIARETAVTNAGCVFAPAMGTILGISHFKDFYRAEKNYGLDNVEYVLTRYACFWPNDSIRTATMLGLLKVHEIMHTEKQFTDDNFDEVIECCIEWSECSNDLHKRIKAEFAESEQLGKAHIVDDVVASGIINIYNRTNTSKTKLPAPYELQMPIMKQEFILAGLYPSWDETTYLTRALYREVCETGDLASVWAHKHYTKWLDDNGEPNLEVFRSKCNSHCACGEELSYGIGENIGGRTKDNQPEADHKDPKDNAGEDLLSNCEIMCGMCNLIKSRATPVHLVKVKAVVERLESETV